VSLFPSVASMVWTVPAVCLNKSTLYLFVLPVVTGMLIFAPVMYHWLGYYFAYLNSCCGLPWMSISVLIYLGTLVPVGSSEARSSLLLIYALVLDSTSSF
jgi:hypothetical protein